VKESLFTLFISVSALSVSVRDDAVQRGTLLKCCPLWFFCYVSVCVLAYRKTGFM
jgi:hypothetical protein